MSKKCSVASDASRNGFGVIKVFFGRVVFLQINVFRFRDTKTDMKTNKPRIYSESMAMFPITRLRILPSN